jgi:dimethylargininase
LLIAVTRQVSPAINQCELTHLEHIPIDVERARLQHHAYEESLHHLGLELVSLPEEPLLPDSVFVEDTAIVLDECAVLTRPGADSRLPEIESIRRALTPHRKLFTILSPGTLDGGDVLTVGRTLYVGLSGRSNQEAIDQLAFFLNTYEYSVKTIRVSGCLHLKSAVTQVGANTLLVNPAWVEKDNFPKMELIEIDPSEPYAANALLIGSTVLFQPIYSQTLRRLEAAGFRPILVDQSELSKAEGGLTCCSLIFNSSLSGRG